MRYINLLLTMTLTLTLTTRPLGTAVLQPVVTCIQISERGTQHTSLL